MHVAVLAVLGFCTAALGTVGGIGGAVVLVPVLVLCGIEPQQAAPLGLLTVAAGSLAAGASQIAAGLGLTAVGIMGASAANVYQAGKEAMRHPLLALLAWSMAIGAVLDAMIAFAVAGLPTFESRPGYLFGVLYLALAGSVLCFALYFPVVRKIGPGKAAYSSVLVPIIAMSLSTLFEGYRWSVLAVAGGLLAIGGMLLALAGRRRPLPAPAPDAG